MQVSLRSSRKGTGFATVEAQNAGGDAARRSANWLAGADARAKIAVSLLASVMTIVLPSLGAQLVLFLCSLVYALGMRRPLLLLLAYLICMAMFGLAFGFAVLISWLAPLPPVTAAGLSVPFLRLMVMVNVILPLAFATSIQSIMASLKSIRLPFLLYIPLAVMVRYIPTILADGRQIYEALKIRGYRLSFRKFLLHPVLSMRFVTSPLIFRSLKTSEDLGIAAELKGLGAGRKSNPYRALLWKRSDSLLLLAAFLVAGLAVACVLLVPADSVFGVAKGVMR